MTVTVDLVQLTKIYKNTTEPSVDALFYPDTNPHHSTLPEPSSSRESQQSVAPVAPATTAYPAPVEDAVPESEKVTLEVAEDSQPAPVVLNLSTWSPQFRDLKSWVVAELRAKYGVHRRLGTRWLEQNRLLLLLDGLDEVPAPVRVNQASSLFKCRKSFMLFMLSLVSGNSRVL